MPATDVGFACSNSVLFLGIPGCPEHFHILLKLSMGAELAEKSASQAQMPYNFPVFLAGLSHYPLLDIGEFQLGHRAKFEGTNTARFAMSGTASRTPVST